MIVALICISASATMSRDLSVILGRGRASMPLLDFACHPVLNHSTTKAFGSSSPDGLLCALERFGLPPRFCSPTRAIRSNRTFTVHGFGHFSVLCHFTSLHRLVMQGPWQQQPRAA